VRFPTGGIPREPNGMNRFDSGGDSKVWMKEDNNITFDVEPWDYSGVFC